MIGVDPTSEGLKLAADQGLESTPRGRRLAAQAGRAARPDLRGDVGLRAPRVRPPLRGGRHPRRRPHAGRRRARRHPAGQRRGAPRRAERQHDHLRRPGHDPDGGRGLAGAATVSYAEIVASVASRLAPARAPAPTSTSSPAPPAAGVETIGGAERGKAIIILNPAEPPMIMRDTIFCAVPTRQPTATRSCESVVAMEKAVQEYVPGYRLLQEPQIDDPSPATQGQTEGQRSSSRSRARATTCRRTPGTSTS